MSYSTTQDERNYYGDPQYRAGDLDAPSTRNSSPTFFLAEGSLKTGYGSLNPYNYLADQDVYSLDILSTGYYKVDVNNYTWDFNNIDYGSVSSYSVIDQDGVTVASTYNIYSDINNIV